MSTSTIRPYLLPTADPNVYTDIRNGQYVCLMAQQPVYLQHRRPMGMPQPAPSTFNTTSMVQPRSYQRHNEYGFHPRQSHFAGPGQHTTNYYMQPNAVQYQMTGQRTQEYPSARFSNEECLFQQGHQDVFRSAVQTQPQYQQQPARSYHWNASYNNQNTLAAQTAQPLWSFGPQEVIDLTGEECEEGELQAPLEHPTELAPTLRPSEEIMPSVEIAPEPAKKKTPSFLNERLRYLKTHIRAQDHPVAIRLLRTMMETASSKQQRNYCDMFWPTNEAALADFHEIADLSPRFLDVYYHRLAWANMRTEGTEEELEADRKKIEEETDKLVSTCQAKLKEMIKAEETGQRWNLVGNIRGKKGVQQKREALAELEESEREMERYEIEYERRKQQRGKREETASEKKEVAAKKKEDTVAKRKADAAAKKQENVESRKRKTDSEPAKKRGRPRKVQRTEPPGQLCNGDELLQLVNAELSADPPADTFSPSQDEEEADDDDDELTQLLTAGFSADTPEDTSSPLQDREEADDDDDDDDDGLYEDMMAAGLSADLPEELQADDHAESPGSPYDNNEEAAVGDSDSEVSEWEG